MALTNTEMVVKLALDNKALKAGLQETQSTLISFGKQVKQLFGAYLGYQAIKNTIQSFQAFNMQIANAQALLGGTASELSAMTNALKRFGGDTNTAIGALKTMQGHLNELKFGGGALVTLAQKYGISISAYSKADKALLGLAKQMQGYSRESKLAIMQTLGLDESMQRAFMDGGKELDRLIKKQHALGTATEADLRISQDFNNAILDLKDIFSALAREMLRGIMPLIKGFVDLLYKFVEILRENKVFVTAFFVALGVAMLPFLAMLAKMAVASVIAFAPFYAIGAVITAIALIFEDLYYYFMGWDSATGELVKKFPFLKKLIEPLRPIVLGIVATFKQLIEFIKNPSWANFGAIFSEIENVVKGAVNVIFEYIDNILGAIGEAFPFLKPLIEMLKSGFTTIKNLVFELWDAVKGFFKALFDWNLDGMIQAVKDALNAILELFSNAWQGIKDGLSNMWGSAKNFFGFGDKNAQNLANIQAPSAIPSNTNNQSVTFSNNISQTFNTNATPAQIQGATQNALTNSVIAQSQTIGGAQ